MRSWLELAPRRSRPKKKKRKNYSHRCTFQTSDTQAVHKSSETTVYKMYDEFKYQMLKQKTKLAEKTNKQQYFITICRARAGVLPSDTATHIRLIINGWIGTDVFTPILDKGTVVVSDQSISVLKVDPIDLLLIPNLGRTITTLPITLKPHWFLMSFCNTKGCGCSNLSEIQAYIMSDWPSIREAIADQYSACVWTLVTKSATRNRIPRWPPSSRLHCLPFPNGNYFPRRKTSFVEGTVSLGRKSLSGFFVLGFVILSIEWINKSTSIGSFQRRKKIVSNVNRLWTIKSVVLKLWLFNAMNAQPFKPNTFMVFDFDPFRCLVSNTVMGNYRTEDATETSQKTK